ncbi:MAG: class I SAM-dependent rRNA methyltransferase [Pseudomonadota bacterium]
MSDLAGATVSARPMVRLRPNRGRRLAEGAPWAYADEIAMDRRTKALASGTVVRLVGADREFGTAAFNPESQIAARLLDPDPEATIDATWFAARIDRALALRRALYREPYYRLVHAEGDGLPGLVIDRFGSTLVIQPNAAWVDRLIPAVVAGLDAFPELSPETVVINATARVRRLEGLAEHLTLHRGSLDGPVPVPIGGATYLADLQGGQKTGIFYDQRPNHAFLAGLAAGMRVLDVFTHTGGFALACLAAGAVSALAVDSSASALALAERGAEATGVADRFVTLKADAFDALRELSGEGRRFDIVVCDPPAFAPNRQAVEAGLRAYEKTARLAAAVTAPGGLVVLCSCSGAVGMEPFRETCAKGILRAGRQGALIHAGRAGPDHPSHLALPETGYLKALVFRLDA